MQITAETHAAIVAAFVAIEEDNGGHLVGTVYPNGEDENGKPTFTPLDMERFDIPAAFEHLVAPAEKALGRLMAESLDDFQTVMTGEDGEQQAILARRGDLADAWELLRAFFDGWEGHGFDYDDCAGRDRFL